MGATWNSDGVIVLAPGFFEPLHAVPAAGGQAKRIVNLDQARGEISHRWPFFLPDGEHYLVRVVSSNAENSGIYLGSLQAKTLEFLLESGSNAVYSEPGYLLYLSKGTLLVRAFDPESLVMNVQASPILDRVAFDAGFSRGVFSASNDGVLVYSQMSRKRRQLCWYDRSGTKLESLAPPDFFENFKLSPDGTKMILDRRESYAVASDLWLTDLSLGTTRRFTFNSDVDSFPIWTSDGAGIIFSNNRRGSLDVFEKPLAMGAEEKLIRASETEVRPMDCSDDGRFLLYEETSTENRSDLWIQPLTGNEQPFPFVQTEAGEYPAMFHPSGRWIAYCSDESFRYEVYVRPFPPIGDTRWQVSRNGGHQPRWSEDGRQLFFLRSDMMLMSTSVGEGPEFEFGSPRELFKLKTDDLDEVQHYDVEHGGERILVNEPVEDSEEVKITVIINWPVLHSR
jgi:Tol biopolymer transport system component